MFTNGLKLEVYTLCVGEGVGFKVFLFRFGV